MSMIIRLNFLATKTKFKITKKNLKNYKKICNKRAIVKNSWNVWEINL